MTLLSREQNVDQTPLLCLLSIYKCRVLAISRSYIIMSSRPLWMRIPCLVASYMAMIIFEILV